MKFSRQVTAISVLVLSFAEISLGVDIPVSPNSELGQAMLSMDRQARAFQNAGNFTRALRDFEIKASAPCPEVEFKELEEPAVSISGKVAIYIMHASCGKGVERKYRVQIKFSDAARTVARSTKIMERLDSKEQDGEAMFEKVMLSYVDCGLKGDVEGMVALTSKVTIAQMGLAQLKEHYAKDAIIALKKYPKMLAGGRVDYLGEENGSAGWLYRKVFVSPAGKEVKFQFVVLKEQGVIGVGSFGLWK